MNIVSTYLSHPSSFCISNPQLLQIDEYEKHCKAAFFFIINTYKKFFKAFRSSNLRLRVYFQCFINAVYQLRAQKIFRFRIKRSFLQMRKFHMKSHQKNRINKELLEQATMRKQSLIFKEWVKIISLERHSKTLNKFITKQLYNEFLLLLRQNKERRLLQKLSINTVSQVSQSIYAKSLKHKSFQAFQIHSKMCKVIRLLSLNRLGEYIARVKSFNKQSQIYRHYRIRKLIQQSFSRWKQHYNYQKSLEFNRHKILSLCFEGWKECLDFLVAERELDKDNDCIVNIFRQRRNRDKMMKILCKWREQARQSKQNRHHNAVLTKYADLKYKEILLRRHFQMLKQHCINNTIKTQFYERRLTRKAFDSLKIAISQSVQQEEKVIIFMQKMQTRRYFERIRCFNQQQKKKTDLFRLSKLFSAFTVSILYAYYSNVRRAESYYRNNLLYKCLFAIKQKASFTKKQEHCITFVNVILPLRRWLKRHRLQQYLLEKQWLCKKKVVREWRLLVICRDSQKKVIRQFKIEDSIKPNVLQEDSKVEEFEFDNIMATIAKIRKNFMAETGKASLKSSPQEINFSYSLQNVEQ